MDRKSDNWPYRNFHHTGGAPEPADVEPLKTPRVTTDRLMRGRREIVVQHGVEEYRLRITAKGKLLLTK